MNSVYTKGDLLQIQTKNNQTIEGRFFSINDDKSVLSLYDVKSTPDLKLSDTIHKYSENEITNIVKLDSQGDVIVNPLQNLKLSEKECEQIIKISYKYNYINQVNSNFHEAIQNLSQCEYIGLSTDGTIMGRKSKMPFMVLSTPKQIYIFDIQIMQIHAFDAGLKTLLESETPKKIIHDSRLIADCLLNKHNIVLSSVFDTLVAHLIILKNKNSDITLDKEAINLQVCLNIYLGLPMNTIEGKLDILKCTNRPLSQDIKDTLAKNIAYLHKMFEVMKEQMLLPFTRGVECFINNIRTCDDNKAWELSVKRKQIPTEFWTAIDY